jgi:nucleoside-diphosphate-sugar epimerase
MSPVLVTGGSGYLGAQLVAALLRAGRPVRATVRSAAREAELRAAVGRGDADDSGLDVVVAELTADDGWAAAVAGCAEVHHVASPIPAVQPEDPDELIVPAREGTLRVLRAARDAGARRVVLTSSFAAVGYTPKPGAEYTEADWTDPDTPGLAPYPRSKAIAERAAWDFMAREGGDTELVVVNPTFILGPALSTQLVSSLQLIAAMLDGKMWCRAGASAWRTCATWPICTSAPWPRPRRQASASWPWPTGRRSASWRWRRSCASGSGRWPSGHPPKRRPARNHRG